MTSRNKPIWPSDQAPEPGYYPVSGAWNPDTGANDLVVKVDGQRLLLARARGMSTQAEASHIIDTLRTPDSVFLTEKDEWYFARSASALSGSVPMTVMQNQPRPVFYVHVRKTDPRAFTWDFESSDPADPKAPLDQSRFKARMK